MALLTRVQVPLSGPPGNLAKMDNAAGCNPVIRPFKSGSSLHYIGVSVNGKPPVSKTGTLGSSPSTPAI